MAVILLKVAVVSRSRMSSEMFSSSGFGGSSENRCIGSSSRKISRSRSSSTSIGSIIGSSSGSIL